jgi:chemotaxis protein CheX
MTSLTLAAVLDTAAADPLRRALLATLEAGTPLVLDGTAVERAGLACVQVLASARATAAADGLGFRLADSSPALLEMLRLAGLDAVLAPLAGKAVG